MSYTKRKAEDKPRRKSRAGAIHHDETELVEPFWERQPWETATAYRKFRVFRDLPTRTQDRAALALDVSVDLVKQLAIRNLWTIRVDAYDAHLDGLGLSVTESAVKHTAATTAQRVGEMVEAEWEIWQAAKDRIVALLTSGDPKDAQAAAQLIREADKVARMSTGQPTEGRKPKDTDDDGRRADLDAFLESLAGPGSGGVIGETTRPPV